jgi:hypothetical protein
MDPDTLDHYWVRYGHYVDALVRDDVMPLTFEEWYAEEIRLAGEQDELF